MRRSLNYKHLHYFWAVARAGGITSAAEKLNLTPQTLSGQVKQLEESVGVALFTLVGKRLELTEAGRVAYSPACWNGCRAKRRRNIGSKCSSGRVS